MDPFCRSATRPTAPYHERSFHEVIVYQQLGAEVEAQTWPAY